MKNYNKEDIKILKRVIKDYEELKQDINNKIKNNYDFEELYYYIKWLSGVNITNFQENEYFDFNYKDMCLSIYNEPIGIYLGDTIEVWNDKSKYYIDTFNNINEIKGVLENDKNK